MMNNKREMAEWILDFFRKAEGDAGQIVLMRNVQNRLHELNPKEREMFVPVAKELIESGYFTYEEGPLQVLHLTEKGQDYINDSNGELDCCFEVQKLTPVQAQYLANWHDSFVNWVKGVLNVIEFISILPATTNDDRQALAQCKTILKGDEVHSVETSLSNGIVTDDVLNKIEALNKKLIDIVVGHLKTETLVREFLKRLYFLKIEADKESEKKRLAALKIPRT